METDSGLFFAWVMMCNRRKIANFAEEKQTILYIYNLHSLCRKK